MVICIVIPSCLTAYPHSAWIFSDIKSFSVGQRSAQNRGGRHLSTLRSLSPCSAADIAEKCKWLFMALVLLHCPPRRLERNRDRELQFSYQRLQVLSCCVLLASSFHYQKNQLLLESNLIFWILLGNLFRTEDRGRSTSKYWFAFTP